MKRMSARKKQRHTVNQHRDPEIYLELQFLDEVRKLEAANHTIILYYVPSNCGKEKDKTNLTHEENMHIRADVLVKRAHTLPKQTQYHKFPANTVDF
jgi:tRNA (Thr-GGU) A37 N-methylase